MRLQMEMPELNCVMLIHTRPNDRNVYYELYPIFRFRKDKFLLHVPITLGTIPMGDKGIINEIAAINVATITLTNYQFRFSMKNGILGEKHAMIVCQLVKSHDTNHVVAEWGANTHRTYIKTNDKLITFKVNGRLWKNKRGTMIREDNGMTVQVTRIDEIWDKKLWDNIDGGINK